MIRFQVHDDYRPLATVGRLPVDGITLFVGSMVLAMLVGSVVEAFGGSLAFLAFNSVSVLGSFTVWQVVTYAWVQGASLWFAVEMLWLFWFGREVERFLGHRAFLALLLTLVLASSLWLTLAGLAGEFSHEGTHLVSLCVFLVFATIFPSAELFFRIQAKWFAVGLLGLLAVMDLGNRDWSSLALLLVNCTVALFCVKQMGVRVDPPVFLAPRRPLRGPRRSARRVGAGAKPVDSPASAPDVHAEIDPLLEKIAAKGLSSLTKEERTALETARERLLSRKSR